MYAIVDIETTGGSPKKEKITEIAVYLFDGVKVVDEFSSLINPERSIPAYITQITGITNEMVVKAPRFFEVAKRIIEITEKAVFVAHNVGFDYGFVQEEYRSLGYTYQRQTLDTVNLSRKLLPGHPSYSLGNLCNDLGIPIKGRHRAAGDDLATVSLFQRLLDASQQGTLFGVQASKDKNLKVNPKLDWDLINNLPPVVGVYYLYDEKDELIYVGKSTNIHSRVNQHLGNIKTDKARRMRDSVVNVTFEETGSELVALLFESYEIKSQLPRFNVAQRKTSFAYGIHMWTDELGYKQLVAKINTKKSEPILPFASLAEAKSFLNVVVRQYGLCQKLTSIHKKEGACFHHSIGQCKGACIGQEIAEFYNLKIDQFLATISFQYHSFFILDKGRTDQEKAVVKVEGGKYKGFGYVEIENANYPILLNDSIQHYPDNKDVQQIIISQLKTNKKLIILPFTQEQTYE